MIKNLFDYKKKKKTCLKHIFKNIYLNVFLYIFSSAYRPNAPSKKKKKEGSRAKKINLWNPSDSERSLAHFTSQVLQQQRRQQQEKQLHLSLSLCVCLSPTISSSHHIFLVSMFSSLLFSRYLFIKFLFT